ncbi:Selenocysteine Lyase [Salmonella enterica subsp. enterica serovar Give str. S5-487]|nr:Selenocysteine Lyase [Salmonella enterica subsp. enterica serovar Give str. S5-487]
MTFPVEKVRADFPILQREVNGLPLAYLDSAASAQKPNQVIDAESAFYRHGYAAVHRGIHTLSAQATESMENVRKQASRFINALLSARWSITITLLSARWSITPTSFPGRCCASAKAPNCA